MPPEYNFHSINQRIGVVPNSWPLVPDTYSEKKRLELIRLAGFEIVQVNPIEMARRVVGKAGYKRIVSVSYAPEIFSCTSFVRWVYAQWGIELPVFAIDQSKCGIEVSIDNLMTGDLVFAKGRLPQYDLDPLQGVGHVGIITDRGTVLHTTNLHVDQPAGLAETSFQHFYKNEEYFRTARRILPLGGFYTLAIPKDMDILCSNDVQRKILQYLA